MQTINLTRKSRHDISINKNGQISLRKTVTSKLNLQKGDCVTFFLVKDRSYEQLYLKKDQSETALPLSGDGKHLHCNSKDTVDSILKLMNTDCSIRTEPLRLRCGELVSIDDCPALTVITRI